MGNATPVLAVERLLRGIHPYLPDKLLLLGPIILGGTGLFRFVTRTFGVPSLGGLYGGTLFVINPFVLDRYLAGHLHFLLGYGLLPWALLPVVQGLKERSSLEVAVRAGLWLGLLTSIDLHVGGIYAVLAVGALLMAPSKRVLKAAGVAGLGGLLSAFWLVPALYTPVASAVGAADLPVYATRPEGFAVLPTLMGMYGFWRGEFLGPAQRIPWLFLFLIPILFLFVWGISRSLQSRHLRSMALALCAGGLLFLLLSAGTSFPPTAGIFRWLYEHLFPFRIYREPQKFLAVVVLVYSLLGAVGLATLPLRRLRMRTGVMVGSVVAVIAYSYTMLWGFWGQARLADYPVSWEQAAHSIREKGNGTILVFPWTLYGVWGFTGDRIIANPAPSFFPGEVLVDREAGFLTVPEQSADPFTIYMRRLVSERDEVRSLGHLVAPLGVRYIVLLRGPSDAQWTFLGEQRDLVPIYSAADLTLYENAAWQADPLELGSSERLGDPITLFRSDREEDAIGVLLESPPLRPRVDTSFPPAARPLPLWSRVSSAGAPYASFPKRCTDGWVWEAQPSRCHLGAVAAFDSREAAGLLWRPAAGARLAGIVISTLTLIACASYLGLSRSQRRHRRERTPS